MVSGEDLPVLVGDDGSVLAEGVEGFADRSDVSGASVAGVGGEVGEGDGFGGDGGWWGGGGFCRFGDYGGGGQDVEAVAEFSDDAWFLSFVLVFELAGPCVVGVGVDAASVVSEDEGLFIIVGGEGGGGGGEGSVEEGVEVVEFVGGEAGAVEVGEGGEEVDEGLLIVVGEIVGAIVGDEDFAGGGFVDVDPDDSDFAPS